MRELKHVFQTVRRESPILHAVVMFHIALVLICLIGWMFDSRTLVGLNVWVKPMKFSISGGIYVLTCGFLITLYPFSRRNWKSVLWSYKRLVEYDRIIINLAFLMEYFLEVWAYSSA